MDLVRTTVKFLLREFIEATGSKYAGYVNYVSEEKDAVLRKVLREEKERLEGKLSKAKSYLRQLEAGKK